MKPILIVQYIFVQYPDSPPGRVHHSFESEAGALDQDPKSPQNLSSHLCGTLQTSPEIFETAWMKKGNLLPSTAGSLWSASNNALGSSWSLITPIKITAKSIFVRNKKNLKSKGKSLTFDPECVTTKTKVGHFLTGMVLRQSFAKRQKVSKQFVREFQTFIKLTICANMAGIQRNTHFLTEFRKMLLALMELESRLVILPYPDRSTTTTSRPFSHKCSMLSSLSRAWLYVDHIWVREGEPTRIKIIVSHDLKAVAFNSIEFVKVADNLDGAVSVCVIQASKVVTAGYLMGSRKTMVNTTGIHTLTTILSSITWTYRFKSKNSKITTAALGTQRTTFWSHISYTLPKMKNGSTDKCAAFTTNSAKPHEQQMTFQKAIPSDTSLSKKSIRSHLPPAKRHNYKKPNNANAMLWNAIIQSKFGELIISIYLSLLLMVQSSLFVKSSWQSS